MNLRGNQNAGSYDVEQALVHQSRRNCSRVWDIKAVCAYRLGCKLNDELARKGFIIVNCRISKAYLKKILRAIVWKMLFRSEQE